RRNMSSRDPNARNTGSSATPTGNGDHSKHGEVVVGREVTYGTTQTQDSGIKQQTKDTMSKAGERVREVADTAGQTARSTFYSQRTNAASMLGTIAHALHETSGQLRNEDQESVARLADQVADQVERFSSSVRDTDLDQIMGSVQDFARRRPEMFLGGAFTLGLLAARFLKSSGRKASQMDMGGRQQYTGVRSDYNTAMGTDLDTGFESQPGASTLGGYGGTMPDEP
ncbi:MAG: hypothetical protein ACYC5M_18780, partial [Anaerolineae bacterium]